MKKVYLTQEELNKNITADGRIVGVVEVDFDRLIKNQDGGIDYLNEEACNQLVTEKYAGYLMDVEYKVVGANPEKNTVFVEVDADASEVFSEETKEWEN